MKRLRKRRKTKLQRKAELRWLFFVDVGLWRVEETEEVSPRFFSSCMSVCECVCDYSVCHQFADSVSVFLIKSLSVSPCARLCTCACVINVFVRIMRYMCEFA